MRLLVVGAWSVAGLLGGLGLVGSGCDPASANDVVDCRDASWWSGRSAEWPVDTFWLGDTRFTLVEAMDRLELPARTGLEALQTTLIVAELELASGSTAKPESELLPHVYAGHAWLAEAGSAGPSEGSDRDARQLADALAQQMCGS